MDQIILWLMVNGSKFYIFTKYGNQYLMVIIMVLIQIACVLQRHQVEQSHLPQELSVISHKMHTSAEFRRSFPKMGLPQHGCTKSWCNDLDGIGNPHGIGNPKNPQENSQFTIENHHF